MIDLDWLFREEDEDENGHEDPCWNPEWPYSSCVTTATKPTIKGKGQDLLGLSSLPLEDLSATTLVVGTDKRVYEKRLGLIECLAPARLDKEDPNVYVDKVDWANFPPMTELASLFDRFFSKYDREVLMLIGRKRDLSGWLYHVPKQEGSPGYVKWKWTDEEAGEFQKQARWIGTIHIHPGECCDPSQTDIDDWAEPEKSGLHLVFGRNGSYTINGAIAGKVFPLLRSDINHDLYRTEVEYSVSGSRSLEEVLTIPKPVKVHKTKKTRKGHRARRKATETNKASEHFVKIEDDSDYVEESMDIIRALKVEPDQMEDLRLVSYGGNWYVMTVLQYTRLSAWCNDVCPTPTAKRLRLNVKEGS